MAILLQFFGMYQFKTYSFVHMVSLSTRDCNYYSRLKLFDIVHPTHMPMDK